MEDKDKIIEALKAEIETLKKVKDFACINLNNYIADNNKLKAENETLKSQLDFEVQKKEVLEAENERLKAENEQLRVKIKQLEDFVKSSGEISHINHEYTYKLKQTLQKIKEIAEKPKLFKDFSEIKTATEVEYDYAAICNELELRLHKVLELITKAEEK